MKDRLLEFIKAKDISNRKFLLRCGLSETYINTLTGNPSGDTIAKIKEAYPELNIQWLKTGEGDMFNDKVSKIKPAVMSSYDDIEDAELVGECSTPQRNSDTRPLTPEECDMCPAKIPFVRGEFVQARDINIRELVKKQPHRLEFRSMRDFIGNPDYAQKVITEAMVPDFQPGDVLFIQYLSDDAKVMSGAIYLVDTKLYGAMVRQVFVDKDCYYLHSINPDYKELKLGKDDVYSFALVLHSLRSNFRISSNIPDATQAFKKREEQVEKLLSLHTESMAEIRMQNERMAEERRRQDEERQAERVRMDRLIDMLSQRLSLTN